MEKETEKAMDKVIDLQVEKKVEHKSDAPKKKASKTWEAMMRLKGSLIVNDPKFLL